jgi:hypothetical protein
MMNDGTYPTSGDETNFLPWDGRPGDGGGFADVLVAPTTVEMVERVRGNAARVRGQLYRFVLNS